MVLLLMYKSIRTSMINVKCQSIPINTNQNSGIDPKYFSIPIEMTGSTLIDFTDGKIYLCVTQSI